MEVQIYRKSSINPPGGDLHISNMFEGCGLIETEGPIGKGALIFNLVKMVVSALHRELECKVEKLKYKKFEVMQPRIKKNKLPTHE